MTRLGADLVNERRMKFRVSDSASVLTVVTWASSQITTCDSDAVGSIET